MCELTLKNSSSSHLGDDSRLFEALRVCSGGITLQESVPRKQAVVDLGSLPKQPQ